MAGLDRDLNMEAKYLKKVLSQVDGRIEMPESLRGDVLRQKIEHIEPAPEPVTTATLLKPRRWLTWQSGLTYAAGLVLLVGLFYGLGFNNAPSGVLEGEIDIGDGADTAVFEYAEDDAETPEMAAESYEIELDVPDMGGDGAFSGGADSDAAASAGSGGPATGGGQPAAGNDASAQADAVADEAAPLIDPAMGAEPRVFVYGTPDISIGGGSSDSVLIGQINGYTLSYYENDGGSYPLTLEVLSVSDDRVISQYDLALSGINFHCTLDDTLALVGSMNGGIGIYTLALTEGTPSLIALYEQSGSYVSARLYNDHLHVATYADAVGSGLYETEELPDRLSDAACVLTAVNLQTGAAAQKAFIGASEEIRTTNSSVLINYDAVDGGDRLAQIALDGVEMRVGSVA